MERDRPARRRAGRRRAGNALASAFARLLALPPPPAPNRADSSDATTDPARRPHRSLPVAAPRRARRSRGNASRCAPEREQPLQHHTKHATDLTPLTRHEPHERCGSRTSSAAKRHHRAPAPAKIRGGSWQPRAVPLQTPVARVGVPLGRVQPPAHAVERPSPHLGASACPHVSCSARSLSALNSLVAGLDSCVLELLTRVCLMRRSPPGANGSVPSLLRRPTRPRATALPAGRSLASRVSRSQAERCGGRPGRGRPQPRHQSARMVSSKTSAPSSIV
jgi:hypothetical protein